jgi:hypothetical protein
MPKIPDWLTWVIVGLVSGMAAVNFAAGIWVKGYDTDQTINALFAALVTTLILQRRGGGPDGGDGK